MYLSLVYFKIFHFWQGPLRMVYKPNQAGNYNGKRCLKENHKMKYIQKTNISKHFECMNINTFDLTYPKKWTKIVFIL